MPTVVVADQPGAQLLGSVSVTSFLNGEDSRKPSPSFGNACFSETVRGLQ